MVRRDRRIDRPRHPINRVREAARFGQIALTRKALREAELVLPSDLIDYEGEITGIVADLTLPEFQFAQERDGEWVDVYRVDFEGIDLWVKLKLEQDAGSPEMVVVISFHLWDDSREV